ncbi:MAG: nitroreductase family protein [Elusimicrobiaceae bacterium]
MPQEQFCSVDKTKCGGDGLCSVICPLGLFSMKDGIPVPVAHASESCIRCGHCVAVCPRGALSLAGMNAQDCPLAKNAPKLDDGQIELLLRSRRSIRHYLAKQVEKEKLARLIDLAHYAPTASNSQQVEWLVLNSRDKVAAVAAKTADYFSSLAKAGNAGKYRPDLIAEAFYSGKDIISRGAPALVFAHAPENYELACIDCTIALTQMELAAISLGLGACWAGFIMMAARAWPALRDSLGVPPGHVCYGGLMLGYPEYKYTRLPMRKTPKIIWG